MANIALTAGMRSNLQSIQSTLDMLNTTQEHLATGLKVNSALDDPTAYFTALTLTARASNLDALKDQMGQAIQTIKAADAGISGITELVGQAQGIAKKAQAVEDAAGNTTQYITLSDVVATDTVTIGGVEFTASTGSGGGDFEVGATDEETAVNLMVELNASAATVTASRIEGDRVYLQDAGSDMVATSVESGQDTIVESGLVPSAASEMTTLQDSYNEILDQIDNMVTDAGYRGNNLLNAENLEVKFEGTQSITIEGFSAKVDGALALTDASWATTADQEANLTALDNAMTTLRTEASKLALNLGVITARESFSTDIANLLNEGAGKLTLADMNEEGANMLALQTKQALGTTALSLSAQAAQSVLRLF